MNKTIVTDEEFIQYMQCICKSKSVNQLYQWYEFAKNATNEESKLTMDIIAVILFERQILEKNDDSL